MFDFALFCPEELEREGCVSRVVVRRSFVFCKEAPHNEIEPAQSFLKV